MGSSSEGRALLPGRIWVTALKRKPLSGPFKPLLDASAAPAWAPIVRGRRHLDLAKALLKDFGTLWETEQNPAERRKLIATLFEQIWQKDGSIVAVKPRSAFASYFTTVEKARSKHPKGGPNSGVTKAGATGLEPATSAVTGQRSNLLSYAPAIDR
jgi:hypothetical protein